jgi:hypothetical protein
MSDQLPVKRTFVADQQGQIVPYSAPPPPARQLSRPERLDAYRAGMAQTAATLRELGFVTHYECEHSVSMEYRGYLFDFRIQKPGQVAHITSRPGGRPNKPNVSIYKLSDEIHSEFALQMMVGKEFSARPIFVALDEGLADPAKAIKDAVMGFLASLNEAEHRLGTSTVGKVNLAFKPEPLPEWLMPQRQ